MRAALIAVLGLTAGAAASVGACVGACASGPAAEGRAEPRGGGAMPQVAGDEDHAAGAAGASIPAAPRIDAAPPPATPPPPPPPPPDPRITPARAAAIVLGGDLPAACAGADGAADPAAAIPCVLAAGYADDPRARAVALALWRDTGDVAGRGDEEDMDGGYRGTIHLVPALPLGADRRHLAWAAAALRDFDDFFARLAAHRAPGAAPPAAPAAATSAPAAPRYRWRDLELRFVRSVKRRTPSAFALPWQVSYNLDGSLLIGADAVRETLFHEIFHMNDADHGDWSATALRADYDAIVARCGTDAHATACLAPYAPGDTKVRGGTYYAFQQDNGDPVHEYAAELALRWYREQREVLRRGHLTRPAFKCGPAENARAWQALVDEFFAGADLTPPCR